MGRVLEERRAIGTKSISHYIDYTYNLDGSLADLMTPPMKTLIYTYNGAGRPTSLVDSTDGINFLTNATYAPAGEMTGATLGSATGFSGFSVSNAYSDRLQPILLSATNASTSATVFSECFDFHLGVTVSTSPCSFSATTAGDNGNVFTVVNNRDNTRTQTFTYDNLNRIVSGESNGSQWGETFTVDAWGNLTNKAGISGKTYGETMNTSALTNNQLSGFGYDAAGNMISNGTISYVYDAENRLIWTAGYRYVYDANGERVEKCQAATVTTACPTSGTTGTLYWKGTGSETLAETDLAGNDEEEYLYFNGQRISRRDTTSTGTTIAVHYYFSDHLGSHGVIYSQTGTTCEQDIDYYPYGGQENDYCAGSGVSQNYKFTGKERDAESGLDNFGARYNSSGLGRFMTPDWAAKPTTVPYAKFGDPQTLNLYSYVENGPLNRVDTSGHNFASSMLLANAEENNEEQWEAGEASTSAASNGNANWTSPETTTTTGQTQADQSAQNQVQQTYGRQPDGSYKADPAKVQNAIDANAPIGNGQCVTSCSQLSGVTSHTDSWTPGKSALGLNDKSDVGLAIATFGSDKKFNQPGVDQNSAIYMGHDKSGRILVVDQWPQNPGHQAPNKHPIENYGRSGFDSNGHYHDKANNAYYYHVIVVQ